MKHLKMCIDKLMEEKTLQNIAVKVVEGEHVLYEGYHSAEGYVDESTLFDMASVTKIVATTTLALMALDRGLFTLDDSVSGFFACGQEKEKITVQNLLTHTIGIGHKPLNVEGNSYENIGEQILKIPADIPIGSDVLYSCPAFILLGKILEKVFDKRLDVLFSELVCAPLGMESTCFCPKERNNIINHNSDEELRGVVNDYNCRFLGGVAGNAGVFSNMRDMSRYAQFLLRSGAPLISKETFERAVQNYTPAMAQDRGLGFLYVKERYAQTGGLFHAGSFGHCGHTGQSVFVHRESGLNMILLTDATASTIKKYGKSRYDEVKDMRRKIHGAIKKELEGF